MLSRFAFMSLLAVVVTAGQAFGQASGDIRVEFTNNLSADGFFFTPVWFGFHDGANGAGNDFDFFDVNAAADSLAGANSPRPNPMSGAVQSSLEAIAEDGVTAGLVDDFANSGAAGPGGVPLQGVITNANGFAGAPVIDPGETGAAFVTPANPANYQYLSFASMLIPSNDTFIGNDNSELFRVFNSDGSLNDPDGDGLVVFQIFAANLFDAGTENDDSLGAAFSSEGGTATETVGGVVTSATAATLGSLVGDTTVAQTVITQGDIDELFAGDPIATITVSVVPEPTSALLIGLGAVGTLLRRKRA